MIWILILNLFSPKHPVQVAISIKSYIIFKGYTHITKPKQIKIFHAINTAETMHQSFQPFLKKETSHLITYFISINNAKH